MPKFKKDEYDKMRDVRMTLREYDRSYMHYLVHEPYYVFSINNLCYDFYKMLCDAHALSSLHESYRLNSASVRSAVSYFEKNVSSQLNLNNNYGLMSEFNDDLELLSFMIKPVKNVPDELFAQFMRTAFSKESAYRYKKMELITDSLKNLNDRLMNESVKQVDYLLRLRKYEPNAE